MFGHRVSKNEPRVAASGSVDELNAILGVARAARSATGGGIGRIAEVQAELVSLMGQLATLPKDWSRYVEAGYGRLDASAIAALDDAVGELEGRLPAPTGWSVPGATGGLACAHLEVARTACRRAERSILDVDEIAGLPDDFSGLVYLNRLSDYLWLLARDWELDATS